MLAIVYLTNVSNKLTENIKINLELIFSCKNKLFFFILRKNTVSLNNITLDEIYSLFYYKKLSLILED